MSPPSPRSTNERTEHQERRTAPGREYFAAALGVCRAALDEQLATGQSPKSLRGSVAAFASLAHKQCVPPERVLAVFKQMVSQLPTIQRNAPDERAQLVALLARMMIDAYYEVRT
jgi:hypothetical protein